MGGYINKTAQWLRKAEQGIQTGMTPVTAGIMQQMQSAQPQQMMQQQQQQDPREQILAMVVQLTNQGYGQDDIKDYILTNVYGLDKNSEEYSQYEPEILEFISGVVENISSTEDKKQPEKEDYIFNSPYTNDELTEQTQPNDDSDEELINDIIYGDEEQARYGGTPNKRSYVNKLMRQLKKAAEGDQVEEANTANVRGTEDNPTTNSPGNKNPFIAGVKGQAENHFLKQQAEQMYNNQFGQGMQQPQPQMDFAQFGGWRMRRANRAAFGTPFVPAGASAKYNFGLLGGLRNAEVQFNPSMAASMFPMMGGYSSFGYNQPYKRTSKGRLVTERIASSVNNESIKDVASSTNSQAATNATAGPCTEDQVKDPKSPCYDPMYTGEGPRATDQTTSQGTSETGTSGTGTSGGTNTGGGGSGTSQRRKAIDGARQAVEQDLTDVWGRSPDNQWYGFDPDSKKFIFKDKWGRSPENKWYGFDPETKQWTLGKSKPKQSKKNVTEKKKDSWGRSKNSKWYGWDDKKKTFTEGPSSYERMHEPLDSPYALPRVLSNYDFFDKAIAERKRFLNKHPDIKAKEKKEAEKFRKELYKTADPKLKAIMDYEKWEKNADWQDRLAQTFGFGPQNPHYLTGFNPSNDDDYLTWLLPTGLGAAEGLAPKLLNAPQAAPKLLNAPKAASRIRNQRGANKFFKDFWKSSRFPKKALSNNYQRELNKFRINQWKAMTRPPKGLPAPADGTQLTFPFAMGGFVNNPMQDQFGNLQKFIYGDEVDDIMLNALNQPINQYDLDYLDSKDTTDAFFRHGGLHRFDGTTDSQTSPTNAPKTYSQEELDKLLAEKQKSWETDYQKKYDQQMQRQQQMMSGYGGYNPWYMGGYNPYDSYSAWNSRGNYGGFGPMASTGLLGAAGNLIKGFNRGPSTYGPAGNPLQYAATAAAITNSGMLPTGMKYSKERSSGLLGKIGLKNDKVWTLDYATPDQIKAGVKPGTTGATQDTSNMSFRDKMINRRDQRLNRNTPAEADAYKFTGTLTGSPTTPTKQPLSNEEMLKAQGKMWDENQKKWITNPVIGNNQNVMTESPGMVGKTPEEIKTAYSRGEATPTVVNKGNVKIINAAGEAIDANDPMYDEYAYGGYIPSYMAYGGYIPEADQGINFSTISYDPNAITQPGGIAQGKIGPCTEEEVKDPKSPCYDPIYAGQGPRIPDEDKGPQTAQLKIKEQRGPLDYTKASRGVLDFAANLADSKQYVNQLTNKILGLNEFSNGEKQSPNEVLAKGEFNARTGKEGIQGFEGIIRKGGAIKSKKSKASGHRINISDFQDLMRLAGLK